jgi:hypothetical protein
VDEEVKVTPLKAEIDQRDRAVSVFAFGQIDHIEFTRLTPYAAKLRTPKRKEQGAIYTSA